MNRRIKKPLKIFLAIIALILFGIITMLLWNSLMPAIFGLPAISLLQAFGLLILTRLLIGHGRFGTHNWKHHRYLREKWENMTPDERKNFCSRYYHFDEKTKTGKSSDTETAKSNI